MESSTCSHCLNTLSISSRMKIYKFLKKNGANTVSNIVPVTKLTQPTVSYHLKEMKEAGILQSKKVGKEVFYEVHPECDIHHCACVLHVVEFPGN